jgi:putative oxidoreductase
MSQIIPIDPFGSWGILLLRIVVGTIFIYHGLPKIRNTEAMAKGMGWQTPLMMALGLLEVASGSLLILGYFIQYAAIALMVVMAGALYHKIAKWRVPFVATDKTGWELDLLLFCANFLILTTGGGSLGIGL